MLLPISFAVTIAWPNNGTMVEEREGGITAQSSEGLPEVSSETARRRCRSYFGMFVPHADAKGEPEHVK